MKLIKSKFLPGMIAAVMLPNLAHAADVTLDVSKTNPQIGDRVTVTVNLSDFPATHGGGLDISFNNNVLRATSVSLDQGWDFLNRHEPINNSTGSINDILVVDYDGRSGSVPVAVIEMEVIGNGNSSISARTSNRFNFTGVDGQPIPVSVNNSGAAFNVASTDNGTDPDTPAQPDTGNQANNETATDIAVADVPATAANGGFAANTATSGTGNTIASTTSAPGSTTARAGSSAAGGTAQADGIGERLASAGAISATNPAATSAGSDMVAGSDGHDSNGIPASTRQLPTERTAMSGQPGDGTAPSSSIALADNSTDTGASGNQPMPATQDGKSSINMAYVAVAGVLLVLLLFTVLRKTSRT